MINYCHFVVSIKDLSTLTSVRLWIARVLGDNSILLIFYHGGPYFSGSIFQIYIFLDLLNRDRCDNDNESVGGMSLLLI